MMKFQLIYLTLWTMGHAAYISRMAIMSNANFGPNRRPTAFRPGVMMRPWHPRFVQAASHRVPYVVYRNTVPRQTMKHYTPTRVFSGPWKATRLPSTPSTTEYEFVRAASAPTQAHSETGAIHTVPAPNLSLSEKPIVVIDNDNFVNYGATSEAPKIKYEVTEKYQEKPIVQAPPKIGQPIGFSKATTLTSPEFESLMRNSAALQLASELGISAISLSQNSLPQAILPQQTVQQQHIITQPNLVPQSLVPQQFTLHSNLQNFNNIPNPQEMIQPGPEGLVISPNALYQPDPAFLQKLQSQLLQRFPGIEFVPYAAEFQMPQAAQSAQVIQQVAAPIQAQPQPQTEPPIFLLQNEQYTRQAPSSFVAAESQTQKSVVQRETEEATVVTLVPLVANVTEKQVELTSASVPQNITIQLVATELQPDTTTVRHVIETTTEEQKTTPVIYAPVEHNVVNDLQSEQSVTNVQVAQSIGNVVTDGLYSEINNVRAAAALAQVEKPQEPQAVVQQNTTTAAENVTTTTLVPPSTITAELKSYFVERPPTDTDNKTQPVTELKPIRGVPFSKSPNSVNVAYTLVRTDEKEAKVAKDGSVYAGQIVEASISEDQDFNKEKASLFTRRAPIRLVGVPTDKKNTTTTTTTVRSPQKVMVVKAKIPQKSKLIFDDKTGEPVLRIYASYVNNPAQKEAVTSKLSNIKSKDSRGTKQEGDRWKAATVQALAKPHGFEHNQVSEFGLKLRSRSDDFVPLFDDYEK